MIRKTLIALALGLTVAAAAAPAARADVDIDIKINLGYGGFYDGTLSEVTWRGRIEFTPQFNAEPTVSWNRVEGPYGSGNSNLLGSRLTYTVTPRMFVAALVQYQSRTQSMSTNVRFRWEYKLGSELFVVYSDGRTTTRPGYPDLENRSVVVKLTRLFRW